MIGAPAVLVAAARTWTLNAERAARPGETDQHGNPAAFVGYSVGHLPTYMLAADNLPNLETFLAVVQSRACEHLRCDVAELTWWAYPEWPPPPDPEDPEC